MKRQQGYALLVTLATLVVLSLVIVGSTRDIFSEQHHSSVESDKVMAQSYADSTLNYVANVQLKNLDADLKAEAALTNTVNTEEQWRTFLEGKFAYNCGANTGVVINGNAYRGLCLGRPNTADEATLGAGSGDAFGGAERNKTLPIWSVAGILEPCGSAALYQVNSIGGTCTGADNYAIGDRTWQDPRYIIELISRYDAFGVDQKHVYRVTTKAWGRNKQTSSTLQAYYEVVT